MAVTFSKHYPLAGNFVVDTIVLESFTLSTPKPASPIKKKIDETPTTLPAPQKGPVIEKKDINVTPKPKEDPVRKVVNEQDNNLSPSENQVGVNVKDFHYDWYIRLILKRIQESWKPPIQKYSLEKLLIAKVDFKVNRNGKISDIKLQNTSENFLYDQAALRTLQNIGQFPPLPSEYADNSIIVHIEFKVN